MHNRKSKATGTTHNNVTSSSSSSTILPLHNNGGGGTSNGSDYDIKNSRLPRQFVSPSKKQLQNLYKSIVVTITVFIFVRYVVQDLPLTDEIEQEEMYGDIISPINNITNRILGGGGGEEVDYEELIRTFPSIQYPLEHSTVIGLYFAASWCPMSTPVTQLIKNLYNTRTISKPTSLSSSDGNQFDESEKEQQLVLNENDIVGDGSVLTNTVPFSIIYISSDTSAEEMDQYIPSNWFSIPFENTIERTAMKLRYRTCAKREINDVLKLPTNGTIVSRKHEIPTFLVLSGETYQVLTYDGIQDMNEYGVNAVDHWYELVRLNRAQVDKY